jgi:hypothetical protein
MTARGRVAAFGALLAAVFALAAIAGRAAGPVTGDEPGGHARAGAGAPGDHAGGADASPHDASAPAGARQLRIVADDTTLTAGRPQRLRFEIQDAGGARVRDFEIEQGRRMHLIVVRRDLRRFQHLHPTQDAGGRWSVRVSVPDAGVYQAFADFRTDGERHALGVDLFAAGRFDPLALAPQRATASADGYDVALHAHGGELEFAVRRGGRAVDDLQPYLGASGHLVMLRAGDLAYEHVHPLAGRRLAFDSSAAGPGTYRLFLQFRHGDRVHTVAFTREVSP